MYSIPIITLSGQYVTLKIFPEKNSGNSFIELNEAEASVYGESPYQMLEENAYEYKIEPKGFQLSCDYKGIVTPFRLGESSGRITPGIFVGTLSMQIIEYTTREIAADVNFEVRSRKTEYRNDYRNMLEYITGKCNDLILQYTSPAVQHFEADFERDPQTLYQRFAFIKSVLETEEFQNALQRINRSPVTAWKNEQKQSDIRRLKNPGRSSLKQFASGSKRIPVPSDHSLYTFMKSVPSSINITDKRDTPDTPENRFVKHALHELSHFCSRMRSKFEDNSRARRESENLEDMLDDILSHEMFKEIQRPVSLPLNSPVLQRKDGYREVLRVWLMFDLAAKLIWRGGDDVYEAGKRDVAVLYEYWLFFRLLELMEEIFNLSVDSVSSLIEKTSDGLGLKLKAGKYTPVKGRYMSSGRSLNIEFSYNKTFSESKDAYPQAGSWTRRMRPDYTLSIWPEEFSQEEAEKQELIVHIHFDAKYKVESLNEILGPDNLDEEKTEERRGVYKRADLLKMHAYKDAIRRTSGAYVIYPGDISKNWRGFHEIIPGLGAFAVRPDKSQSGIKDIKNFIKEVLLHFTNRISQHERHTYKIYEIHKDKPGKGIHEPVPEQYGGIRNAPLTETFVLIGYCRAGSQYDWIINNNLYNARMESSRGSVRLNAKVAGASYLLLHTKGKVVTGDIWRIIEEGPRVYSKSLMIELDYPSPSQDNYLIYKIVKVEDKAFDGMEWDISKLSQYKPGRGSAIPFAVSLADLMKVKKR